MRLPRFTYLEPKSLEETLTLLSNHQDAVIKAGGTDLLPRLKWKLADPKFLINLRGLSELDFIRQDNDGNLQIGALTPLGKIESSPLVRRHFAALADAVSEIATNEIRNLGTIGGNICLDTRCQFYNQSPLFRKGTDPCIKVGGSTCYIYRKGNRCHCLFCADTVPLLIAADAKLKIVSPGGERLILVQGLYTGDGKKPFALQRTELVTEILIPQSVQDARALYLKFRFREAIDFPVVGVAVLEVNGKGGQSRDMRVVVGAVNSRPVRCLKAEALLQNNRIDDKILEKAGETAVEEAQIVSFSGCSVLYRRTLVKQLLMRGVQKVLG